VIYAYVQDQWVPCRSQYYAAFVGHSEKELTLVTEVLRQQARMNHRAVSITPGRLADFLAHVQEHERVLVQRLRDQEAQVVLDSITAGIEGTTAITLGTLPLASDPNGETDATFEVFGPVDLSSLPIFEEYR